MGMGFNVVRILLGLGATIFIRGNRDNDISV